MPVLVAIAVVVVFAIVYPAVHGVATHPLALLLAAGAVVAVLVTAVTFIIGLSRRQRIYRAVAPPRMLPSPRRMPEPLEPVMRFGAPAEVPALIEVSDPASFTPPPPAVAVISQAGLVEAEGECEFSGCRRSLADGAWELEVREPQDDGGTMIVAHWFCSGDCADQWRAQDEAARAAL